MTIEIKRRTKAGKFGAQSKTVYTNRRQSRGTSKATNNQYESSPEQHSIVATTGDFENTTSEPLRRLSDPASQAAASSKQALMSMLTFDVVILSEECKPWSRCSSWILEINQC
ncbi:hypothetical protein OCU04_008193 [Sclerotinia nivalis]|uniref:Uncharacterized protein n=1 Tax=Sclerotinia nivalis TaxID=352851 RepID=A0A9X0AHK5_9HELO|nr:hypothetical protein OCU04_008193 [Sclerotinia nivalis]